MGRGVYASKYSGNSTTVQQCVPKKISTLYLVNRTLETFFWDTLLRVRIEIQIQGVPKNVSRVQKGKYKERKCFLRHPVDFLPPRNGNLISFLNHFFLSLGCFVVGMLTQ